jgi:hypothetical protein
MKIHRTIKFHCGGRFAQREIKVLQQGLRFRQVRIAPIRPRHVAGGMLNGHPIHPSAEEREDHGLLPANFSRAAGR